MTTKNKQATRERFAVGELMRAIEGLEPAYIEALAIVGEHLKAAPVALETPDDQPLSRVQEAVRHVVLTLAGHDPLLQELALRLAAELETTGATETRH